VLTSRKENEHSRNPPGNDAPTIAFSRRPKVGHLLHLEVTLHYSTGSTLATLAIALALLAVAGHSLPRSTKVSHRILGSLFVGSVIAALVIYFYYGARHATLAKHHTQIASTLFGGWLGITVIAAVITFPLATWRAGARRNRLQVRAVRTAAQQAQQAQQALIDRRASRRAARAGGGR